MLTLKNGTKVRILSESKNIIKVVETESCGFDSKGGEMFQTYVLSKTHHKGYLLLDGLAII